MSQDVKLTWTVGIDNCRNLGVGVDSNELRRELVVLHDVDGMWLIWQIHLLQSYTDLYQPSTQ
jgi:hypothetical protein